MQNWLSSLLGILAAVFVSYPRVHPSVSCHTAASALSWSLPLMTVYLGPQWELMLELLGVVGTQTMACPPPLSSVATGSRHQGSLLRFYPSSEGLLGIKL